MKYTIFADTHLNDFLGQRTLKWLLYMLSRSEKVIIAGDFWEQHDVSFDQFLDSGWRPLFSRLKQKKAIYLPGNHDSEAAASDRWRDFADTFQSEYSFASGNMKYIVSHGHEETAAFDKRHPTMANRLRPLFSKVDGFEFRVGIRGWMYTTYMANEKLNNQDMLTEYCREHFSEDTWRIFGHIHLRMYDPHTHYINTGRFGKGWARWIEIEDGKVTFFENRIDSDPPGA